MPKAKIKPNLGFKMVTTTFSRDGMVYQFKTWPEPPFKKPPFKNWEYVNPSEGLIRGDQLLANMNTDFVKKTRLGNDTLLVEYRPYYEPKKPISYKDYNQFVNYVKDSIVRISMGKHLGMIITNYNNGKTRINWETPINYDQDDVKSVIYDLYYSADMRVYKNPYVMDKSHFKYVPDLSINANSEQTKRGFKHIYPDTAKWVSQERLAKDSVASIVMAKADWYLNMNTSDEAIWLDSAQAFCYVDWVNKEWLKEFSKYCPNMACEIVDFGKEQKQLTFSAEDLSHFRITESAYREFVLYCRDSILKRYMGGIHEHYKNDGTIQINWKEPILFNEETRAICAKLLKPNSSYLNQKHIRYRFQLPDYKHFWEKRNSQLLNECVFNKFGPFYPVDQSRYNEPIVPIDSVWFELLQMEQVDKHKMFRKSDELVKSLSYQQAKAYWHWRLNHQIKDKKKQMSDYMFPNYQEWKQIQSGAGVKEKSYNIPKPGSSFSYRVYVW
ncbi:MAG: hypothetical protein ACPGLV_00150 [Bacteroidia bacterium]